MNYMFQTDLDKRKKYLKVIAKNHPLWFLRMAFSWLLILIAFSILIGIGYVLFSTEKAPNSTTILVFFAMGICLSCVPFIFGLAMKRSTAYSCASPYSGMTNVTLILNNDYLELIFWKASKAASAAYSAKNVCYCDDDKFVYRFEKDKIKKITIDKYHICHVTGEGTLTVPMWASTNDTIETKPTKSLSFVTCFTDSNCENIIKKWRDA